MVRTIEIDKPLGKEYHGEHFVVLTDDLTTQVDICVFDYLDSAEVMELCNITRSIYYRGY